MSDSALCSLNSASCSKGGCPVLEVDICRMCLPVVQCGWKFPFEIFGSRVEYVRHISNVNSMCAI